MGSVADEAGVWLVAGLILDTLCGTFVYELPD
jgi:hypothetical protein